MIAENKIKIAGFIIVCLILGAVFLFVKNKKEDKTVETNTEQQARVMCFSPSPFALLVKSSNPEIDGNFYATITCQTLYTSKDDSINKSNCNGACTKLWIPYIEKPKRTDLPPITNLPDDELSGLVKTFKRDDGSMQYSIDGKPLYTFANDTKPGEVNGVEFGMNHWEIVRTK